jgi:hypothetical protein
MGTTVGYYGMSKMDVFREHFGKPWQGKERRYHVDLPHSTRSGVWARLTITPLDGSPGYAVILFHKLDRAGPRWAEKSMDETAGPCEVDCPLALLDLVPLAPEAGEWAREWRDRVRAYHAAKRQAVALARSWQIGDRIEIPNAVPPVLTIAERRPGGGAVGVDPDGRRFRISRTLLQRAVPASAAA